MKRPQISLAASHPNSGRSNSTHRFGTFPRDLEAVVLPNVQLILCVRAAFWRPSVLTSGRPSDDGASCRGARPRQRAPASGPAPSGRRFLYGGSVGVYHRGPLSPRWKNVTQKGEAVALSSPPLPPCGSSVSQPPSLLQQPRGCYLRASSGRSRTEGRKRQTVLVWAADVSGSDVTAGHTPLSTYISALLRQGMLNKIKHW